MPCADERRGFGTNVLNSCLEQNIKIINQFRHLKHTFLCREGMLLGTFARNQFSQFSDALTTEKSQAGLNSYQCLNSSGGINDPGS